MQLDLSYETGVGKESVTWWDPQPDRGGHEKPVLSSSRDSEKKGP